MHPPTDRIACRLSFISCSVLKTGLVLLLLLLGSAQVGVAQQDRAPLQADPSAWTPRAPSPAAQLAGAVEAIRIGDLGRAEALLTPALDANPALVTPESGSAAYWLGTVQRRTDRPARARTTWRTGMDALRDAGRFDVRLADAYLETLTPAALPGRRLDAVAVYADLLRRIRPNAPAGEQDVFRRHLARLEPMMPDDVFSTVVASERDDDPATWTLQPNAGERLTVWWRRLDPLPGTPENERLEEHVTRLVHATRHYSCAERTSGLDDRGQVYLRFGEPYKTRSISYADAGFIRDVYRFGVAVSESDFPDNDFWLYTHIDDAGYYLFAREPGDCYAIAGAPDLLPPHLKTYRGTSERGLNIAYSAMKAMEYIYEVLALYHIDYSARYTEIANYAGFQEMQAAMSEAAEMTGGERPQFAGQQEYVVGAGVGQTRRVYANTTMGIPPPNQFVRQMVSRAEMEEQQAERARRKAMPRQHTAVLPSSEEALPIRVRTARFLTADGATQAEVYWGLPAQALALEDTARASLVTFSAVRYDDAYRPQHTLRSDHVIPADLIREGRVLILPPERLPATTEVQHLGLQWMHFDAEGTDRPRAGTRRHLTTGRADSLAPLRAEGALEVSDVKVLAVRDTAEALLNPLEAGIPYPFRAIRADRPMLLYLEVYHLTYAEDDRTRYTVAYEVEGRTRRGWTRLFRGQDTQRTATETTIRGTERRTQEAILLDLSELAAPRTQDVRVTVRVTDDVTGTTRARTVDFVLMGDE